MAEETAEPHLDVAKLHALPSEQQDLFLLSFVSELRQYVEHLSAEQLPAHQAALKKEIIKIVGLGAPAPSRVVRNTLGKTLGDAFGRGGRSLLFETIQELLAIVNSGRGDKDIGPKHAAVVCLGEVFLAAGDSAISLAAIVCTSLLRLIKHAHAGLKGNVLRALGNIATGTSSGFDEHVARDVWKQARNVASGDKAAFVQVSACLCLRALIQHNDYFINSNDFGTLRLAIWKTLDNPIPAVRHAAARTLATLLLRGYSESSSTDLPVLRKPKKTGKKLQQDDDEMDAERPVSPLPGQAKPAIRLAMNLSDLLQILSHQYVKASTSTRFRAGLAVCYRQVLRNLPATAVQDGYGKLIDHFSDILNHPTIAYYRYRILYARKMVHILLVDVLAAELLTEAGQIIAAKYLINEVIKNYPQVIPERKEPSKRMLTMTLDALTGLLKNLGSAANVLQDTCRDALFQIIRHPNYTVRIHVAVCFKELVLCCPTQLVRCLDYSITQLQKDLEQTDSPQTRPKLMGFAKSVAAMMAAARQKPLHGSIEQFSRAFTFAIDLLKSSAGAELRLSAIQIQVAWTLIGGLISLGPSFTKVHLNQILIFWRNTLPPPLTPENAAKRSQLELSFLAHVRECALGAMLVYLDTCSTLVTSDGSRRLSSMLQNTILFLESLPATKTIEDVSQRLTPAMYLADFAILLRRRVLQCLTALVGLRHLDQSDVVVHSDIIALTMKAFTSPERPPPRNIESSLSSSASSYEGLWEAADNWGFGVGNLLQEKEIVLPFANTYRLPDRGSLSEICDLDAMSTSPVGIGYEHDSLLLYRSSEPVYCAELCPPATATVNAAIRLFAMSFPLQLPRVQESSLEQLTTLVAQPLQRDPGRKAAIQFNAALAVYYTLLVSNNETPSTPGKFNVQATSKIIVELSHKYLLDADPIVRGIGAYVSGRFCNLAGTQFTNVEVKYLIDTIVANRDPNARAGCALALGQIHAEVGAMAASLHIKTIVGVLLSLCNDPHPVVHYWSLKALVLVADSAGLNFSTYATSTLGMLAQLYSSDSHNDEGSSLTTSNLDAEFPTTLVVAHCIDSIINVLGPDLQDATKPRQLILMLTAYFQQESSSMLQYYSFLCSSHLSMFVPAHLQFSKYVQDLQKGLGSTEVVLRNVSISSLADLFKRSAKEVERVATSKLSDDLWTLLDQDPSNATLRSIFRLWLQQTALSETAEWVLRCEVILSRTRKPTQSTSKTLATANQPDIPDVLDEEVAGFATAAGVDAGTGDQGGPTAEAQEFLRWQTRDFAMSLLSELLELVQNAMLPDQVVPSEEILQGKIADIVRVAFSASTASVIELRIWGLRLLDQILTMFGKTPDPDFTEVSLLEQYQAQISSALTPAFAVDSTPELAAEAVTVCATFVAAGIATTVDRMGRIFKVLALGLDNIMDSKTETSIGDLKNISSNAQSMLRMAILTGWADLQLASGEQPYLEDILKPYLSKLAPLWLKSLQEFAGLRFEPEISDTLGGEVMGGNLDERYAAFNREVRLRFYQSSWLIIVDAVAGLVEKDSDAVFEALNNGQRIENGTVNGTGRRRNSLVMRTEPVTFFFTLFGLAFEAIVRHVREDPSHAKSILQVLQKILTPGVCGHAVYENAVFNETTDMLDRLAMTSNAETQSVLVGIARNLSLAHPSAQHHVERDDKLSDDIEQLFELTRIVILILVGLIPTLEDPPGKAYRKLGEDGVVLIQLSFQALVDVADVFPAVIRADLHACILHCYCSILATGICQDEVVPRIMPIFRNFLLEMVRSGEIQNTIRLVRGCLHQMLAIFTVAQRRENEHAVACAKNTLLSLTVLLTSASVAIPAGDELIVQAVSEIVDNLQSEVLAKVAINCLRSLLASSSRTPCDEQIARLAWPRLLVFVVDISIEDHENVRSTIVQALCGSVAGLRGDGRTAAMSILIPVLLNRARQKSPKGSKEDLAKESATRLLELAGIDQTGFRATVGLLDSRQRTGLEALLRMVGVGQQQQVEEEEEVEAKPAIELRMDF